jgi:hypothetical protein
METIPDAREGHESISFMVTCLRFTNQHRYPVIMEGMLPPSRGRVVASVILAKRGSLVKASGDFVVWTCCEPHTEREHYINGFYADTFEKAFEEFTERVKRA